MEKYRYILRIRKYLESLKIPIYVNGNSIVIGFSKEDEEQKKKEGSKKLKLSFKENEIRDYKEIGEYYTGYCIFKSKIEISSYVGTRYYYESDTLDGIVNKLKVESEKKLWFNWLELFKALKLLRK